eukprot:3631271-Amphidinium_carterae.1
MQTSSGPAVSSSAGAYSKVHIVQDSNLGLLDFDCVRALMSTAGEVGEIGSGAYATVFCAVRNADGVAVALKEAVLNIRYNCKHLARKWNGAKKACNGSGWSARSFTGWQSRSRIHRSAAMSLQRYHFKLGAQDVLHASSEVSMFLELARPEHLLRRLPFFCPSTHYIVRWWAGVSMEMGVWQACYMAHLLDTFATPRAACIVSDIIEGEHPKSLYNPTLNH